jgi:hypothetical protein
MPRNDESYLDTGHFVRHSLRSSFQRPTAWERITSDPRQRDGRQHPLRGSLGTRTVNGEEMDQWQYEVTSGGRLWYCIDDKRRTILLTDAMPGHPKATE